MSTVIDDAAHHTLWETAPAAAPAPDILSFAVFRRGDLFCYAPPRGDEGIYRIEGIAGGTLDPIYGPSLKYDVVRVERRPDCCGFAPVPGAVTQRMADREISSSLGGLVLGDSMVEPEDLVRTIERNLPEEYGYLAGGQAWPNSGYAYEAAAAFLDGVAAYVRRLAPEALPARKAPLRLAPLRPASDVLPYRRPEPAPEPAYDGMVPPNALPPPAPAPGCLPNSA